MKRMMLMCVSALLFLAAGSSADYRYYAWTYQYITMFPGGLELEFYARYDELSRGNTAGGKWKRQTEIEAGLTSRWDASLYFVESTKDGLTKFDEIKLRTRFKLMEKEEFFVDPILYAEYKIQADRSYPDKWEFKLILAKDIGDFNIAFNYIPEEAYLSGKKVKYWKHMYAGGISFPPVFIGGELRIGAEITGDFNSGAHYFGPAIAFKGKQLWASVSPVFGMSGNAGYMKIQGVVGLLFNLPGKKQEAGVNS